MRSRTTCRTIPGLAMSLRPLLVFASITSLLACTPLHLSTRTEARETPGAGVAAEARPPEVRSEEAPVAQAEVPQPTAEPAELAARRESVAKRAAQRVGRRGMVGGLPDDCAGLVRHAYRALELEVMPRAFEAGENAVTAIHREAQRRGALEDSAEGLRPGDIVFFRETYDRNRDGKRNDGLTHAGIVETVEEDGTVVFIHRGMRGVARSRFNTSRPDVREDAGRVLNDWLRRKSRGLRAYFAGELYAGFASAARLLSGAEAPTPAEGRAEDAAVAAGCTGLGCDAGGSAPEGLWWARRGVGVRAHLRCGFASP